MCTSWSNNKCLVPLIFKCSLNSQTPNELSYTDDKFPFKDREPLALAAVHLPFIYLCFLNYVTKFLNYTPKRFLPVAPHRKPVFRNAEFLSFRANLPKCNYTQKGVLARGRQCIFHLIKIMDL